ncbi:KdsC family phosphatase [Maribacter sp. 2307ULW6-5]|uniref:KdsC family phosphatase n=1 Tax=Maribacter sp. 2307ULW6-5 TaxID=3386275 RepID=UPI0039BC2C3C
MEKSYKEHLKEIDTFVFDVDGVFTDGTVIVTTEGELLRRMNVKDGFALKAAVDKGYRVCIITGGTNDGVKKRLQGLGVTDFYMGTHQKKDALQDYMDKYGVDPKNVLYMGDDIPDVPPLEMVGLPTCPQNAVPEVKRRCVYISHLSGGNGCVRDVLEQVMKVRGDWMDTFDASNP